MAAIYVIMGSWLEINPIPNPKWSARLLRLRDLELSDVTYPFELELLCEERWLRGGESTSYGTAAGSIERDAQREEREKEILSGQTLGY